MIDDLQNLCVSNFQKILNKENVYLKESNTSKSLSSLLLQLKISSLCVVLFLRDRL